MKIKTIEDPYDMGMLIYEDLKNREITKDDIIRIDAYSTDNFTTSITIHTNSEITIIENTIKVTTDNRTEILDLGRFYKVVVW